MRGTAWTAQHSATLRDMAAVGYTDTEIAAITGHCRETVRRQRRAHGLPPCYRIDWSQRGERFVHETAFGGIVTDENLQTVEQFCGANEHPFNETWWCVKAKAAALPGPADLKRYYFATGDVVAERVAAGQMTDAEARMTMAKALSEATSANAQRQGVGAAYRPTVYQRTGPNTVIAY